jgi:hypothetical protein
MGRTSIAQCREVLKTQDATFKRSARGVKEKRKKQRAAH